jgi:hypothetical protein
MESRWDSFGRRNEWRMAFESHDTLRRFGAERTVVPRNPGLISVAPSAQLNLRQFAQFVSTLAAWRLGVELNPCSSVFIRG